MIRYGSYSYKFCSLQPAQLSSKRCETHPCNHGQPLVTCIRDNVKQRLYFPAANRRDDPKLGKMSPDHVHHRGLLANEQMPRAMERQTALLLGRSGCDKPHIRPGNCFADRLRVSSIILLPFDVRLHVGWRHQQHRVAECLELALP